MIGHILGYAFLFGAASCLLLIVGGELAKKKWYDLGHEEGKAQGYREGYEAAKAMFLVRLKPEALIQGFGIGKLIGSIPCPDCSKGFSSKRLLAAHTKRMHVGAPNRK